MKCEISLTGYIEALCVPLVNIMCEERISRVAHFFEFKGGFYEITVKKVKKVVS